jgi:PIN domain nuclease of toxin-antitoxin system
LGSIEIVKLLLDTHIWIWSVADRARLKPNVLKNIQDPLNEIWLSPISSWELILLTTKGRLRLGMNVRDWIEQALSNSPLKEAPLTTEVVLATKEVVLPHRDPADLFLAATAKVFDLTLVTADARLLGVEGLSTLANR